MTLLVILLHAVTLFLGESFVPAVLQEIRT